jgi:hypothetical protein
MSHLEVYMSATATIVIVVIVVVVGFSAILLAPHFRRRGLRERFGPEYERTVRATDDRRAAEWKLLEHGKRHAEFEARPLSPDSRRAFEQRWTRVQERFADTPADAVSEAGQLITDLLTDVGYPARLRRAGRRPVGGPRGRGRVVPARARSAGRTARDYRAVFDAVVDRGTRDRMPETRF